MTGTELLPAGSVSTEVAPDPASGGWGALSALPGHPMMWVLILCEIVTFGLLILTFVIAKAVQPELFAAGQRHLDPIFGGINTIVLITSGWLAARAVTCRDRGRRGAARFLLSAATVVGVLFVALKLTEYGATIAAGFDIETNSFFALYFLLTGFHLAHVVMGMVVLAIVAVYDSIDNMLSGTSFWHMVDLVWVVLYPILYIMV